MANGRLRLVPHLIVLVLSVLATLGVLKYWGMLGAPAAGVAESTLDRVIATKTLRFGIPIGDLPVAVRDEKGQIVGLVPDIAAEMAKALKVNLEIVETTAPNRIPFIQAGKIDLSIGTITLERAKSISFGGIWVVDGTTMAVLQSSGIKDYEALKSGKTIAVVTGATGDLVATKLFPNAKILRFDQPVTAIQAVLQKQADAVSDDISTVNQAADKNKELRVLSALTREPSGVMIRLGDQKWINWVNYFLDDFYGSGVSTCGCGKEVLRKWLKGEPLPLTFNY
jgi:polar amino acid transport system substrate-binding protein